MNAITVRQAAERMAGQLRKGDRLGCYIEDVGIAIIDFRHLDQHGENAFAERYLYLPSVGFVLALAAAWQWLAGKQREMAWAAVALIVNAAVSPKLRDRLTGWRVIVGAV